MVSLEQRRRDIARTIRENPTTITIQRTRKMRSGGGFEETTSTAGPYTVRIYRKTGRPQTSSELLATVRTEPAWGLLADHEADIQAGQDVRDEFDALGGRFRVTAVRPEYIDGELAGLQCDIEKVG